MPIEISAEVTGLKELEKALLELSKTYGDPKFAVQALRPAIRAALKPIEEIIRGNTPVDTGRLKDSVKLRIRRPKKVDLNNPNVGSDAVIIGVVGWEWRKPSLNHRALSTEFGNAKTPAQPVLRPALENNFSNIVKTFKDTLGPAIKKKAAALAKKNNRR